MTLFVILQVNLKSGNIKWDLERDQSMCMQDIFRCVSAWLQ